MRQYWAQRQNTRMETRYGCLKCGKEFAIEVTEAEQGSSLESARVDACPECSQRVGTGPVRCRNCGATFVLAFPHWHAHCDLAGGDCPECGTRHQCLCVC